MRTPAQQRARERYYSTLKGKLADARRVDNQRVKRRVIAQLLEDARHKGDT